MSIFKIAYRELFRLYGKMSGFLLLIVIPFAVFLILNNVYNTGNIHDLPIAVYDQDHSPLSRTLTRFLDSSPYLEVKEQLSSEDDMQNLLQSGKVQGIVYIPRDVEKRILKGRNSEILIYTNSSNIVFGNLIYKAASEVVITTSAGILLKKMQAQGLTQQQALDFFRPVQLHFKPLFNPSYNYLFYLSPGLMTVLFQMFIMFVAVRAFNSEWEAGTIAELIKMAKGSIFNMLMGKYLAHLFSSIILVLMIFGIFFPWFNLPLHGSFWGISLLLFAFITANIFMGFAISIIFRDKMIGMDIVLLYNSPAFVFSGFTFPLMGLPWYSKMYAGIIPYTHFIYGFFKLELMDAPFKYAMSEIMILLIFIVVGITVSFPFLSIQIDKFHKKHKKYFRKEEAIC